MAKGEEVKERGKNGGDRRDMMKGKTKKRKGRADRKEVDRQENGELGKLIKMIACEVSV